VLAVELSVLDEGLTEAVAVASLNDIETWYAEEDQIPAAAADLRSLVDTTTEY
jgi:hypothetical protein